MMYVGNPSPTCRPLMEIEFIALPLPARAPIGDKSWNRPQPGSMHLDTARTSLPGEGLSPIWLSWERPALSHLSFGGRPPYGRTLPEGLGLWVLERQP